MLQRLSDRREDRIDCRNHVLQCAEITPSFCPPAFATPQCLVGYEAASIDFLGPSEEGSLLPEEVPGPSTHSYSPNDLMNLIPTPNNQRSSPSPAQHRERESAAPHAWTVPPPTLDSLDASGGVSKDQHRSKDPDTWGRVPALLLSTSIRTNLFPKVEPSFAKFQRRSGQTKGVQTRIHEPPASAQGRLFSLSYSQSGL